MRIFSKFLYPFILSVFICSLEAEAQNLERIIKKHSEAIGGHHNWETVKSYKIVMENERENGNLLNYLVYVAPW